jgi:raffinose/stachyose/melibiose transport system permease protein
MSRVKSRPRTYGNDASTLRWIYAFILPGFLVFLAFYLYPILTVVVTSFTSWDGFNAPGFIGVTNYIKMFNNAHFLQSLVNLILWSLIAMTLHTGYGVVVAFVLRRKLPLWRFAQTLFMVPNVISVAAWAMIYKYFFRNDIGILNSLIRLIDPLFAADWFFQEPWAFWAITLTWLFYAVIVTLLVQGDLLAIPSQLHEAAIIDGATEWQRIWKIDLPLCRNSIGTGIICSITARIAMYESIYLTTNGAGKTMNIPVLLVRAIQDSRYGYANAHAVIMLILGVLTLLLVNRLFRMDESVY